MRWVIFNHFWDVTRTTPRFTTETQYHGSQSDWETLVHRLEAGRKFNAGFSLEYLPIRAKIFLLVGLGGSRDTRRGSSVIGLETACQH